MRKLLIIATVALISFCQLYGQKSPEKIYRKYAHDPDYTTIFINGGFMWLINRCDREGNLEAVSSIRIVAQNEGTSPNDSFYDEIVKGLDHREYEELIKVQEYNNHVLVLVKDDGKYICELLVIVGGEDNALIHIKGKLSLEEAEKITDSINVDAFASMN